MAPVKRRRVKRGPKPFIGHIRTYSVRGPTIAVGASIGRSTIPSYTRYPVLLASTTRSLIAIRAFVYSDRPSAYNDSISDSRYTR